MTAQLPSKQRLETLIRAIECESYDEEEIVSWVNSDEILSMARALLAAHEQEPVAWQDAVERFREYNIGFPVERFKADYVISWVLANYPRPAPVPAVYLSPDTEYMAEDAECLAMNLDKHNVPKEKDGQELSLWGRVVELCSQQAPVPAVPECFERLLAHAQGIAMGVDWNKGTAATHHRDKLCQAVKDCAAILNGGKS